MLKFQIEDFERSAKRDEQYRKHLKESLGISDPGYADDASPSETLYALRSQRSELNTRLAEIEQRLAELEL